MTSLSKLNSINTYNSISIVSFVIENENDLFRLYNVHIINTCVIVRAIFQNQRIGFGIEVTPHRSCYRDRIPAHLPLCEKHLADCPGFTTAAVTH